jgi:ribose 5-phosphate isomerase B
MLNVVKWHIPRAVPSRDISGQAQAEILRSAKGDALRMTNGPGIKLHMALFRHLPLTMKIAVGSDEKTHLTDLIAQELDKRGYAVELFGPLKNENMDWPHVAERVAERVAQGEADEGILFCWTGTGVSLAANKVPGIRAALCHDAETARGARLWNRANILCLS